MNQPQAPIVIRLAGTGVFGSMTAAPGQNINEPSIASAHLVASTAGDIKNDSARCKQFDEYGSTLEIYMSSTNEELLDLLAESDYFKPVAKMALETALRQRGIATLKS